MLSLKQAACVLGVPFILLSIPLNIQAAILTISPTGTGTACSDASPCAAQQALDTAVAGDEIVAKDGTYTVPWLVNANAGTSTQPITVRAENQFQAILNGDGSQDVGNLGIDVHVGFWAFEGLKLTNHWTGVQIRSTSNNGRIENLLITSFTQWGINTQGDGWVISESVIGHAQLTVKGGGIYQENSSANQFRSVAIYAINADSAYLNPSDVANGMETGLGSCGTTLNGSNGNLYDGIVCLAVDDWVWRFDAVSLNTFRNSIVAFNNAYGLDFRGRGDNLTRDNLISNNIFYESNTCWRGKGNTASNRYRNNLCYMTAGSGAGVRIIKSNGEGDQQEVTNNIFYSEVNHGALPRSNWLMGADDWADAFSSRTHNLYWANNGQDIPGWYGGNTGSFTLHATELQAEPLFVDAANYDFQLEPGSPGEFAGDDGNSMGVEYNDTLSLWRSFQVLGIPRTDTPVAGTTVNITGVSNSHEHILYLQYADNAPLGTGEQPTITVEGTTNMKRDLDTFFLNPWAPLTDVRYSGAARNVFYGVHAPGDTTLTVSFTGGELTSGEIIHAWTRQLPTVEEAWQLWTQPEVGAPPPPPVPTGQLVCVPSGG